MSKQTVAASEKEETGCSALSSVLKLRRNQFNLNNSLG